MPEKVKAVRCHVCKEPFVLGGATGYHVFRDHLARCRARHRPRRKKKGGRR